LHRSAEPEEADLRALFGDLNGLIDELVSPFSGREA
jgi:hypothetical protein